MVFLLIYKVLVLQPGSDQVIQKKKVLERKKKMVEKGEKVWVGRQLQTNEISF